MLPGQLGRYRNFSSLLPTEVSKPSHTRLVLCCAGKSARWPYKNTGLGATRPGSVTIKAVHISDLRFLPLKMNDCLPPCLPTLPTPLDERPLAPPTGSYASTLQFLNPAADPDLRGLNTPGVTFSDREVVRSPTKTKVGKPVSKVTRFMIPSM